MNELWARWIIELLLDQGIDYFCISPGSRSTPLTYAVAQEKRATAFVHFDERGLGFHALGYGKATGKPAVVIVTSGTAVANLFPAVVEAHLSRIPLILITADRPPELRGNGANQSIDQIKIFGNYVDWHVDLPCPDAQIRPSYLATTIAYAASQRGPVHLNCPFREPFFQEAIQIPAPSSVLYEKSVATLPDLSYQKWAERLSSIEKGVIVLGRVDSVDPFIKLAEKLRWPLLADITSGPRKGTLAYSELKPEAILHFGGRLVSNSLKAPLYFHVSDDPAHYDPLHQITHHLECNPAAFCEGVFPYVTPRETWLAHWQETSDQIKKSLDTFFNEREELSEPYILRSLEEHLTPDWNLFIANSMPIRDADQFLFPQKAFATIFANRGASGIDGNIATAIGIAQGSKKSTCAILGDQTFLHDLNSLAMLKNCPYPVKIVVINNGGGGIFSFLPIAQKRNIFEKYWAASHDFSFEKTAEMFALPYLHPENKEAWHQSLKEPISCLIEIKTQRDQNALLHQELQDCIRSSFCTAF